MNTPAQRHILLMLSGSIAAYKACELISAWRQAGHAVRVMATPAALKFVGAATLEGLSGHPVLSDTFASGHAMAHIDWVRWAHLVVLCPATANRITGLQHGRADDLAGTAMLAVEPGKPVVVIPAMNTRMWQQPAMQEAVIALKQRGITILPPATGSLACGETGEGRLPAVADILAFIDKRYLNPNGQRILITAGGTSEAIDAVRVISNRSSGRTGAALANAFSAAGHHVTLLRSHDAAAPRWPVTEIGFGDFADLQARLKQLLQNTVFDLVLHAAAVSDYSLATANGNTPETTGKISSDAETLTITLKRNPKLVDAIKGWSTNPNTQLVAFKLTASRHPTDWQQAITKLQNRSGADWVVHNDQLEINAGKHCFRLFDQAGMVGCYNNVPELFEALEPLVWPASGNAGNRRVS